jgi:hypothetical protein
MMWMEVEHPPRWPWWIVGVVGALSAIGLALEFAARHVPLPPSWYGPRGYALPTGLAFAITGALIATKARANPIGRIVCAASLFISVESVVGPFVIWSVGGKQDLGLASGILLEWVWIPRSRRSVACSRSSQMGVCCLGAGGRGWSRVSSEPASSS